MSSLLYFNSLIDNVKFEDDSNFMYDFFKCFCPDVQSRKNFIQYLLSFSSSQNEAISRQELLKLFVKQPLFFNKLISDCKNFILVNNQYLESNKILKYSIDNDITAQSYSKLGKLQNASLCLKKLFSILRHIKELIFKVNDNNTFLNHLQEDLNEIFDKNAYCDLIKILDYLQEFRPDESDFKLLINVNDFGKVSASNIIYVDKEKNTNRILQSDDDFILLLQDAYESLFDVVSSYIESINSKFIYLYDELMFYKVALRYYEYLNLNKIPSTFPKYDKHTNIENLIDFFLAATIPNPQNIVSNNFALFDKKVVLITGDNGTGKTVFLRSIYFALLFGRAGLPIPAKKATISLYNNIAIKFADNDTNCSSAVGRFEKEVKSISNIFYNIQNNSVAFFNEVLQSTSYSEAEYSLANIIKAFSKRNVTCVLVTHLRGLPRYFEKGQTENFSSSLETSKAFRILKIH